MSLAAKFRNRAEECRKTAEEVDDLKRVAMLREIANCWVALAEQIEAGLSPENIDVVIDDLKSSIH
jgi:hypothetical protein